MTTKTFTIKSNAVRDARKTLNNPDAKAGEHFTLAETDGRWTWAPVAVEAEVLETHHEGSFGGVDSFITDTETSKGAPDDGTASDPLVYKGVRFGNMTRLNDYKRGEAERAERNAAKPEPTDDAAAAPKKIHKASATTSVQQPRPVSALKVAAGERPAAPDFSAPTHKAHLKRHAAIVALADANDVAGLKAYAIEPTGSSRRALIRYRDAMVAFLEGAAS